MSQGKIDLAELRERLRVALPQLTCSEAVLEHSDSREQHVALVVESTDRIKDHVYRMTIAVIDDEVNFFVHIHGQSKDLTTQGAKRFSKMCASTDEVFAIVRGCWTGTKPS